MDIEPTNMFHPLAHLFWSVHTSWGSSFVLEWWATALFVGIELAAGFAIGVVILKRKDLP